MQGQRVGWEKDKMGRAATRFQADATANDVDVLTLDQTSPHLATSLQDTPFTEADGWYPRTAHEKPFQLMKQLLFA